MRAGVDQKIAFIGVGEIRMHGMVLSESKQENLHPGKREMIHDLSDIRRNQAEIFRNDRKVGEVFVESIKKIFHRYPYPFSIDRCFFARGDFPVGDEAPKMVNSQRIKKLEVMGNPFYPPLVAVFFENTPTINRVAPQLPSLTEIVGRDTRDEGRCFFPVQFEEVGVCPDICAVKAYVDRQVPKEVHALLLAIGFKRVPLLEEKILPEFVSFEFGVTFFLDRPEGFEVSISQLSWPLIPHFSIKAFFQDNKEREIFEPRGMLRTKRFKGLPSIPALDKVLISPFQQPVFVTNHLGKIATAFRKWRNGVEVFPGKKAFFNQQIRTDEERVPCKGRDAAIGRISINRVGRIEREDLPVGLLCLGKKIGEPVSLWSQVSNAVG
jgi:hypothetical protein